MADGAAILAELDTKLLQKLYDRQIRISVSNLDIPPSLPGFVKEGISAAVDAAVAPKFDMDLEMLYESDGKPGRLQVGLQTSEMNLCPYDLHESHTPLYYSLPLPGRRKGRIAH